MEPIRRCALIVNPVAGRGRPKHFIRKVVEFLESRNIDYDVFCTEYPGHATEIAHCIGEERKWDAIAVLGGDGTIREVVMGIFPQPMPLLLIPLGTGNDFYKTVFSNEPWYQVLERALLHPKLAYVDVGMVDIAGEKSIFVNGIGMGFDAAVVENLPKFRYLTGDLLYLVGVLYTFPRYHPPRMRATSQGHTLYEGEILLFSVGNGQFLGGGFHLFPKARLDDAQLDVTVVDRLSIPSFLRKLPKVYRGEHLEEPEVHYFQVSEIEVSSEQALPVQADGELLGRTRTLKIYPTRSVLPILL